MSPYSKAAKYRHNRQRSPRDFGDTYYTVPFHHVRYRGKKFRRWHRPGSGALAVVGRLKSSGRLATQSILIPKGRKRGRRKRGRSPRRQRRR